MTNEGEGKLCTVVQVPGLPEAQQGGLRRAARRECVELVLGKGQREGQGKEIFGADRGGAVCILCKSTLLFAPVNTCQSCMNKDLLFFVSLHDNFDSPLFGKNCHAV